MEIAGKGQELVIMLNDLVRINESRAKVFRESSELIKKNPALKQMFDERATQSERMAIDLSMQLRPIVTRGSKNIPAGKIYESWKDILAALEDEEHATILDRCEQADDAAFKAYELAIITYAEMNFVLLTKLIEQKDSIRRSYDQLEMLNQNLNEINI